VTSRNQSLSPNDNGRQWRQTLGTRLAVLLREALLKSLITFCLIDMGFLRRKEPCYRYEFTPNNNTDCDNLRLVKCLTLWV